MRQGGLFGQKTCPYSCLRNTIPLHTYVSLVIEKSFCHRLSRRHLQRRLELPFLENTSYRVDRPQTHYSFNSHAPVQRGCKIFGCLERCVGMPAAVIPTSCFIRKIEIALPFFMLHFIVLQPRVLT